MRPSAREEAPTSWTARVFAPLALLAAVLAIFVVISSSLDDSTQPERETVKRTGPTDCQPDADKAVEAGYYVLEAGEDLSVVEEKTCIDIEELEALNPNLDPQQLPVGGCVDLVADGCKVLAED